MKGYYEISCFFCLFYDRQEHNPICSKKIILMNTFIHKGYMLFNTQNLRKTIHDTPDPRSQIWILLCDLLSSQFEVTGFFYPISTERRKNTQQAHV